MKGKLPVLIVALTGWFSVAQSIPVTAAAGSPASGQQANGGTEASRQPSNIPSLVQDRIAQIRGLLQAKDSLSTSDTARLSSDLLHVNAAGELDLEFHATGPVGQAQEDALRSLGATVLFNTADIRWAPGVQAPSGLGVIQALVPAAAVDAAAALPWVVAVTPTEHTPPDVGTMNSEGVQLHRADQAQTAGFNGAGVTVGVISDGVFSIAQSQARGELPPTVVVEDPGCTPPPNCDEGTAMLEIVHDMAPGAPLRFHGTGGGVPTHIAAQQSLATNGARVITEDIPFDTEPAFQKGAAAQSGDSLAVSGVSVHSSAGNLGDKHAARVTATGTGGGPDGNAGPFVGCTNNPDNTVAIAPSNDTTFDVQVPGGDTLNATLQWSEPRAIFPSAGQGGFTDLNLYIMDSTATICLGPGAQGTVAQGNGVGDTMEVASFTAPGPATTNVTVKLVVDIQGIAGAVAAPILDLRWRGGPTGVTSVDTPTRAGSLNPDDNYTDGATSEAAVQAGGAGGSTDPAVAPLESFSAGGPIQLITTTECPNGAPGPCNTPGNMPVAGGPGRTLGAPSWTAADGVSVSGVGGFGSGTCPGNVQGDCRFFGTSAATPHGAAIDAIVRQSMGGTPTVASVNQRLASTAKDRGTPGFDNLWGAGILDAHAAAVNQADLRVSKDCVPNVPVLAGQQWDCTITVDNLGPSVARNFKLTDTHVSNGTFTFTSVMATGATCTMTANPQIGSGTVTCTADTFPQNSTITVKVSGKADQPQDINDTATATSDTPDPNVANNTASDSVSVFAASDLTITKSDSPDPVIAGTNLTYTIDIKNNGPSTASNVVIRDFLPAGVTIVSVSSSGASSCNAGVPGDASQPTTCQYGTLAPSATRTMTIVVKVDPDVVGIIHNDAQVSADTFDPDTSNNAATADTTVNAAADLTIDKTDSPDPVLAGRKLTYTLTVSNGGPSTARDVLVTDNLPNEVDYNSSTISNGTGTCVVVDVPPAPPSKRVECRIGTIRPNTPQPVVITIETTVKQDTPDNTTITNNANVSSSTTDPDNSNNNAQAQTLVNPRSDLSIVKTSDKDVYKPSSQIKYTITVRNAGPSAAPNTVVTDNLPPTKQAIYNFDTGGCTKSGLILTCNLGTIAAGDTVSFNLYVTVKGSKGQVVNKASVTSASADPNTSNNSSTRTVLIGK